ncbi:MAG: BMC domain-containing protein [Lachnospiraceae bacterium]|nr:BMC domain-containing protein [Lachnospiraceae bacterium]
MSRKSIGLIETMGLCAGVTAADAAVKSANVTLIGYEYSKGDGMCTVKVEGDVGAVKAAVAAGSKAAEAVCGIKSVDVIARPANGIIPTLIFNKENVGGEYHLKTGIRPKGQSAGPVLVKRSKPETTIVAEPVAEEPAPEETPVIETPEETPVEEIKEEAPVEVKTEEPVEEPVSEEKPVEDSVKEDTVEAKPEITETATEVKEEVTETKTEEPKPAEDEAPADAKAESKKEAADDSLDVKSTSRGKRGGRRPRGRSPKKDDE